MCERQEAGQGGVLDRLLEEGQEAEQRDVMDGVVEMVDMVASLAPRLQWS